MRYLTLTASVVAAVLLVGASVSSAAGAARRFAEAAVPPLKAAPAAGLIATDAASDFRATKDNLASGLSYSLSTSGCSSDCATAASAVVGGTTGGFEFGFNAWSVSGSTLTRNDSSPDTNPCTGSGNSVSWAPIDGAGGTLAETFPCVDLVTRHVVGFRMIFDSGDSWSDCTSNTDCQTHNPNDVAISAVAAHEAGHVFGLGHVHAPRDARLTMFFTVGPGDWGHATLGCGDRLGVNKLYGTTLNCTSLPGD